MRVTIDPRKARELLALNTNNRRVSKGLVSVYAADMAAARWPYNGDPIRVSKSGILLDGQHRLLAIIESGASIECELIEGLPDEVLMTIDGGRKRTPADVLNITRGASMLSAGIAATARQTLNYLFGYSTATKQSTPAVITFLEAQPDIFEKYTLARKAEKVVTPSALGTVLFLGTRAVGMDKRAMQFVEPLREGDGLSSGDPRLALRNAFINARMRTGAAANTINIAWAMMITARCWNAFATGEELHYAKSMAPVGRKIVTPNIIGGPTYGAGLAALSEVRINPRRKLRPADRGDAAVATAS